ncbi:MAG: hypothetical protein ACFFAY_09145 [Promethearchaeota archaeon]
MTLDSTHYRCLSCQQNRASHFCEDCGSVLCSECLQSKYSDYTICKECHHPFGKDEQDAELEACPECESENLSTARRTEDMCPQCHSGRIMPVEEKRRTLAQGMRQSVMMIQYGHTKLREFASRLDSAKRTLVSLRMANFLHYHWLEEKLEEIQDELPAIKNRVGSQAEITARRMAAETNGLIDYIRWTPEQFPFIEGVTNRVRELGEQYRQNTDDALDECRVKLAELTEQLDGLNYYRGEFSEFYNHIELAVNELPVCALPDIKVVGSDFLKNDKASGTLYITNKRIILVAETGIVRKKTGPVFDFPLLYLNAVEEDGRLRKRLVLRMKQGYLRISCSDETMQVLPDYISIAQRFEKYVQTDLQRVRKIEQKNVNISDVRMKIERLVHSLLSGEIEPDFQERYRNPFRPGFNRLHGGSAPLGEGYVHSGDLRNELERRFGERGYRSPRPSYQEGGTIDLLKRNAREIDDAIQDTIEMMRRGHLGAEDFIRRYRGLVRDSYYTKREIERKGRSSWGQGY